MNSPSLKQKILRTIRLGPAVRLVWECAPGWTMGSLALQVVQGVLPLVALYLMKLMLDAVAASLSAPDRAAFERVAAVIAAMGAVALFDALVRYAARLVGEAQSAVVTDHMYDVIHTKSVEVDLEYYESAQYFDTLHRAQREAPFRPTSIVNGLTQLGQSSISLLGIVGLLFSFHWAIAAVLFVAIAPDFFVRLRYSGQLYRWQQKRTSSERKTGYFNWILTGDRHAKEIRLFDLGRLFIDRARELRGQIRRERLEITARRSLAELTAQAIATIAIYGSYAFIAYRTVQGAITLGDLVMYYQAFQRGQGFLQAMLSSLAGLYEDNLFLSYLYEFLELKPKVAEPGEPSPVPHPMKGGIVLDHLSFRYPGSARNVLDDVSLTISPGEVVALVGENGSGKTTLIKLLCRLYDPLAGTITLDGTDLRRFETAALRREFGVIFQDYAQYYLTARENIWFGNVSLPPDGEMIAAAAQRSGADEVIARLPRSYETILGKWFEDGEELSIGEWQKVALARAFLRDAQIIVLDEPTSAMDARAEYAVFQKFRQLAQGRTAIIISHRFSTVRMADRIYVLEGGRIAESGSHEELVSRGGIYAHLFEAQAQYYR